jgi:hypothetical protein
MLKELCAMQYCNPHKNFNRTQPYISTFEVITSIHTAEKTSFNTKDIKFEN